MSLLDTPTPGNNRRSQVVALQFYTEYEPDPANPAEMVAHDFVVWGRRGDLTYSRQVDKVARVRKNVGHGDDAAPNPVWDGIREGYEAWKSGQETPSGGLALEAWPGLTPTQCRVLREGAYRCVEDVAAIADSDLSKVRLPGARLLRDRAIALLKTREGAAHLEAALADRDAKMAEMQAQMAEQSAQLAKAMAALEALTEPAPPPAPARSK